MPSMALAASRRSSRFVDDVLLFLLLEAAVLTSVEGVIEYAAFTISMMDGFSFLPLPLPSDCTDTANISVSYKSFCFVVKTTLILFTIVLSSTVSGPRNNRAQSAES